MCRKNGVTLLELEKRKVPNEWETGPQAGVREVAAAAGSNCRHCQAHTHVATISEECVRRTDSVEDEEMGTSASAGSVTARRSTGGEAEPMAMERWRQGARKSNKGKEGTGHRYGRCEEGTRQGRQRQGRGQEQRQRRQPMEVSRQLY